MNVVVITGRLTRDPEVKTVGANNTLCARFTLACDRMGKDKGADFPNCVAWGKSAELVQNYIHKGSAIGVEGRLQTGSYEKQDGTKVYTTEVMVNSISFLESKKAAAEQAENAVARSDDDGFMTIPDDVGDDGLPFN